MDKELLRIVIIATGFVVIIGMILWSYIKNRNATADEDAIASEKVIGSSGEISEALRLHTERDEFDIVPVGSAKRTLDSDDNASDWDTEFDDEDEFDDEMESDTRNALPEILQFGVVASDDEGFNGLELVMVFESVGLEYGDMKVYERINKTAMSILALPAWSNPAHSLTANILPHLTAPASCFISSTRIWKMPKTCLMTILIPSKPSPKNSMA